MNNQVTWRVSSFCAPNNDCIEVGRALQQALIRDTKNRAGGRLALDARTFTTFVRSIKEG
ncbi:DUF397 domain-containing protein [Actinokineospora enzanensis]|uniref:DUF397 domain-containing protein n=1 Tax=Actinokineospora enzanensis TaxID=155975 RepID=UPI0003743437|nr:DUF397 domain-containing protein [Actinokineospora enzanensis]